MPSKEVRRQCQICRKTFRSTQSQVNMGRGLYCGSGCQGKARRKVRPVRVCSSCGAPRAAGARDEKGMCRRCAAKSWGKRGRQPGAKAFLTRGDVVRPWAFGNDSAEAKAERAKVWLETDERPRVEPKIKFNTMTKHGRVLAAGVNEERGRYYALISEAGEVSFLPAHVVEG
jgi:hypothetical protein